MSVVNDLVSACVASYSVIQPGVLDLNLPFIIPPVAVVNDGINACLIGSTADGLVVAFRGTIPIDDKSQPLYTRIKDWVSDFDADLCKTPEFPGQVHSGFLASFNSLCKDVELEINKQLKPRQSLYITGHSKGGSMALLATYKWRSLNPTTITFASPRVGNKEFETALQLLPINRYESQNDIVPFLPTICYRSDGQLCFINNNSTVQSENSSLKVKRLGQFAKLFVTLDFDAVVKAHPVANYSNLLKQTVSQ